MKNVWKKVHQVEDMGESFDAIFIHGYDMLFDPFAQNQIQFQKPPLLAPVYQSIHSPNPISKKKRFNISIVSKTRSTTNQNHKGTRIRSKEKTCYKGVSYSPH